MNDEERTTFHDRRIGMADIYGTTAEVWIDADNEITLWMHCGQSGSRAYPTPEAARQLAGALLDAAEAVDK